MTKEEAIKAVWLDGFECGVDVVCDLASEARRERLEHWEWSDTYADIESAREE